MHIRLIDPLGADAVAVAGALFDERPQPAMTRRFLESSAHILLIAYEEGEPAGFVTGVELLHPDKDPEIFVNELGVDDRFRGRGIATALIEHLKDIARTRGCAGVWTATEAENGAALRVYEKTGASEDRSVVHIDWALGSE